MAKKLELTPRLRMVADLVPAGERLADVGTDHAYLPAALGYGAEGNQELEVAPNSTLYYEIELIGVEPAGKNIRTGRRATKIEF